jgi:hyperosmotically inducible protein
MIRKYFLSGFIAAAIMFAQEPDNTKKNKRDDHSRAVTPERQSNDKADLELTRKIRAEISSQDHLSTYAKNVKIISSGGMTVLRGPVRSAEEKSAVETIAEKHAGAANVKSYLEVAPEK